MIDRVSRLALEDFDAELRAMLEGRVHRLGYLGEFFRISAAQPEILKSFLTFTEALKEALPSSISETAILSVASIMENDYERNQHERLCMRLGNSMGWIAAVERLDPDNAELMTDEERATQRLVIAAIRSRGKDLRTELDALIRLIGPNQTIALLFLIGRYMTHALLVNAFELVPPVSSIFEEQAG